MVSKDEPQDLPDGLPPDDLPEYEEAPFSAIATYTHGIIPMVLPLRQVHLFSGASGAGKTSVLVWMLRQFITGGKVFGHRTNTPCFVGFVVADRAWDDHALWLEAVGLDVPHVSFVDSDLKLGRRVDRVKTLMNSLDVLVREVGLDDYPDGSLIVVDPIAPFLGGKLNDYDIVAETMLELNQVVRRRGITMIGVVHAGKQKNDPKERYTRPQDRILGSTALTSFAGTVIHLSPPTETNSEYHELTWVPHHAKAETFRLLRNQETGLLMWKPDEGDPFAEGKEIDAEQEASEKVLGRAMALLPMICGPEDDAEDLEAVTSTAEVLLALSNSPDLPLSRRTVFYYLATLEKAGLIRKVKHGAWRKVAQPEAGQGN